MSVTGVIGAINTQLAKLSQIKRIYTTPREAINLADFPAIVMGLPDNMNFKLSNNNLGRSEHTYSIMLWLFVGSIGTSNYSDLQARVMTWPDLLLSVLTPDALKVTGSAVFTGGTIQDALDIGYRVGPIPWSDGNDYYGLTCSIVIMERTNWT